MVPQTNDYDMPKQSSITNDTPERDALDRIFDRWRGRIMTKGLQSPSSATAIDAEAKQAIQALIEVEVLRARIDSLSGARARLRAYYPRRTPEEILTEQIEELADLQQHLSKYNNKPPYYSSEGEREIKP